MIGAIGSNEVGDVIVFEVSEDKIITFRNFNRTNSVRFAVHEVLLGKPISQYVGQTLDEITFQIQLRSELGVDPRSEMDKLINLQRGGVPLTLIIGERGFGRYRWTINSLNMIWNDVDSRGFLHSALCEISLKEYV